MIVMAEGILVNMLDPDCDRYGLVDREDEVEGFSSPWGLKSTDLVDALHLQMFEDKRVRITIEEVEE